MSKNSPYLKVMEGENVVSIAWSITTGFIPLDINNPDYQNFTDYLSENNLTIDDVAVYEI